MNFDLALLYPDRVTRRMRMACGCNAPAERAGPLTAERVVDLLGSVQPFIRIKAMYRCSGCGREHGVVGLAEIGENTAEAILAAVSIVNVGHGKVVAEHGYDWKIPGRMFEYEPCIGGDI